jgi:adenine-specific DNA-methyltransferase
MNERPQIPAPNEAESPALYADRIGQLYAARVSNQHKKQFGQYLTPPEVARFMARQSAISSAAKLRILDPGAGAGVLSCALCEALALAQVREVYLETYEADARLAAYLEKALLYTERWLAERHITLTFKIHAEDFILKHADAVHHSPNLFSASKPPDDDFDLVISNPPYFKLPRSDPRAQAAAVIVHGQPNIYAVFMATAAALLKPQGKLVFITPRSYAAGPYFRVFRQHFFTAMQPEAIHLFNSRKAAFRHEEVLQENVILIARKASNACANGASHRVRLSSSAGIYDLEQATQREVELPEVLETTHKDCLLKIPIAADDDQIIRTVRAWTGSLQAYGLAISTGPVVPFRATEFLVETGDLNATSESLAPLLWMQNVKPMKIEWPLVTRNKQQYIRANDGAKALLVPSKNYVLLRRFSAKEQRRRLTAAPLLSAELKSHVVGLENHLNYIYRPKGALTPEESYGLAVLLNSSLIDSYFRTFNGNTQVSATELRTLPLPPLASIVKLGQQALACTEWSEQTIDEMVAQALSAEETHHLAHG